MDSKGRKTRHAPYQEKPSRACNAEGKKGQLSGESFFDCNLDNGECKVRSAFVQYLSLLSDSVESGVSACITSHKLINCLAVLGSERKDEKANDILRGLLC